jgi:hypothetical protein
VLSLLDRWLNLSEGYFRVLQATITARSAADRASLRAVIEAARTQLDAAKATIQDSPHNAWLLTIRQFA